jgi:hypothetical protein
VTAVGAQLRETAAGRRRQPGCPRARVRCPAGHRRTGALLRDRQRRGPGLELAAPHRLARLDLIGRAHLVASRGELRIAVDRSPRPALDIDPVLQALARLERDPTRPALSRFATMRRSRVAPLASRRCKVNQSRWMSPALT